MSDDTGHAPEELHEFFKRKFIPSKEIEVKGALETIPACTHDLKKDHFFESDVDKIRQWYAEPGGYIPDPNEVQS
jgi:hypothetical protein